MAAMETRILGAIAVLRADFLAALGQRTAEITLTLPPELLEQFDAAAARHQRSRAAMLAIVIREWLEAATIPKPPPPSP
jgi:hypothetical protein